MTNHTLIKERENQIRALHLKVEETKSKKRFLYTFKIKKLERLIAKLEAQQFIEVDAYLDETLPEYTVLVTQNLTLLKTDHIVFKVYDQDYTYKGSYTKEIKGDIHANGYSYSHSEKTNWANLPFENWAYTKEMEGQINHWGQINLITTKTGMAFLKNLPKEFEGFVNEEGFIKIKNIKNEWDVFTQGKMTIGKLIANHFGNNEEKLELFTANKIKLKTLITEFRKAL